MHRATAPAAATSPATEALREPAPLGALVDGAEEGLVVLPPPPLGDVVVDGGAGPTEPPNTLGGEMAVVAVLAWAR